jgi:hypothetical protein
MKGEKSFRKYKIKREDGKKCLKQVGCEDVAYI